MKNRTLQRCPAGSRAARKQMPLFVDSNSHFRPTTANQLEHASVATGERMKQRALRCWEAGPVWLWNGQQQVFSRLK